MNVMLLKQPSVQGDEPDLPLWAWAAEAVSSGASEAAAAEPSAEICIPCVSEPQAPTTPPTLAGAIEAIASWGDLPLQRQRDLASSLRRIADLLARPAEAIMLNPSELGIELSRVEPAMIRMSKARLSVVTSNLRFVMRRLGVTGSREARTQAALPAKWLSVVAEAADHAGRRGALTRFAAFCNARGIPPTGASDELLAAFDQVDRDAHLSTARNPAATVVARAWTALARRRPDLGVAELRAPRRRSGYVLPLAEFPEPFQQDVARFLGRLSGGEGGRFVVGADGPKRALRPATLRTRAFLLRQAASILVLNGVANDEVRSLAALVTPITRAGAILEFLAARQERQARARGDELEEAVGGQLATMAETLRQVGRYYLKLPKQDVEHLSKWAAAASPRRTEGLTQKNQRRLRALIQPRPYALFLHLPTELRRTASQLRATDPEAAARAMRTAVAVELLTVFPLRRETLRSLGVDQHLLRLDAAQPERVTHLVVPDRLTKNSKRLELKLSRDTADLLAEYLRNDRPELARAGSPFMFATTNSSGAPSAAGLAGSIATTITRETGVKVNLHLLRHLAAYTYLKRHPGRLDDVRRILGHRDPKTTAHFYVAFQDFAAAERFDEVIFAVRRETRALAAAARARPGLPRGPHKDPAK